MSVQVRLALSKREERVENMKEGAESGSGKTKVGS